MPNKKVMLYMAIAVVVLIVFLIIGKRAGWIGDSYTLKVSTEDVKRRTITEIITANGKIQPETDVAISADVSGEIVELHVVEGQNIEKDMLLLKIKPDIYESNRDRAEAALNSAKSNFYNSKARLNQVEAQFRQTELGFNRSKTLWEQKTISDAEYEQAQSSYEIAKAEVDAAQQSVKASQFQVASSEATLQEARDNLMKTSIYAPMSGTISKLNVEVGERVVGTIQMAGTEIMRIANLSQMEVQVDVNENDIVRVSHSDTAIIEVDAYLDEKFTGVVTEIANSANVQGLTAEQVTNFSVKIRILQDSYQHLVIDGKQFPFRPGMSATTDIQTNRQFNVISVPIQAVTTRTDSTGIPSGDRFDPSQTTDDAPDVDEKDKVAEKEPKETVFTVSDGKAKLVFVKTGIQDNMYIEVIEGLSDSSQVIVAPYNAISRKLKNDMPVEVVKQSELFTKK